ncbi:hypothetical protein TVAG_246240 [Trichomonas vaginalis G3]|uniref:Tetraspanin family protein n=1 Tax=Trichomonas vaginalis (strain ATCC PRA-98 / G3) TaxID=412133 RepID=A2E4T0_TRIV3|nr:tetraspanin family [Trichomonas vaginalis G3]EAY12390.1 hypothetical protein TVAG_246240 [Trichomonas vaginalis G3]KAI5500807.1 tetraspanin family [Trichomonas vaginalis G3]|eukprot:XP_001324613.1 hypothetical protein [Trichomonas vaginalis G3]
MTAIMNAFSIVQWMKSSGLVLITNTPFRILEISIFSSFMLFLFMWGFSRTKYRLFPFASALISIPTIFIELYFGYVLIYDIDKFFILNTQAWAEGYQSNELTTLQRRYNCCGYFSLTDFPNVNCPTTAQTPCMHKLKNILKSPLSGCGVNSISDGIIRALAVIAFYFSYSEEEDINAIDDLNSI